MTTTAEHGAAPTGALNAERTLTFSGAHVAATVVRNAKNYRISERATVINCGVDDVHVAGPPRRPIPPLTSTILSGTTIEEAELLVVLRTADESARAISAITDEPGWSLLGDLLGDEPGETGGLPFDKAIPLWRSPLDGIGRVAFDPAHLLRESKTAGQAQPFEVRVNLWFAPAGTDCFIHNRHDFIEVHTQVAGCGRMQKFTEQDHGSLYQDVLMSPGYTTPDPFCSQGPDGGYVYPWHQYRADTDCVWLAVEYHNVVQ
jgi:hypothetical protein